MESSIIFDITTTNEFLANLLEDALDKAVSSEPMEVNGVEVRLTRVGEAEIRPSGKKIDIYLPLKIQLKREAGLFTVEGNGAINLHLAVHIDISNTLKLKAKSELVTHEWLEKPVLEIGALNIPIETLVNLVLNHHESIITAKIDNSLQEFSDLNKLLQGGLTDARKKLGELDLKGNRINLDVDELILSEPKINDGKVNISGIVRPDLAINDDAVIQSSLVPFRWMTEADNKRENKVFVPITFDYNFLENELRALLQGMEVGGKHFDVRSIEIKGGEELNIRMVIDNPIKAEVFIKGKPVYNEIEGQLILNDIDVKVNPSNFIYKLTAPLVNRFIENKMEDFFPLSVNEKLSELVSANIPKSIDLEKAKISIAQNGIQINQMRFLDRKLNALAQINGLSVASVIG
jgi:hypothetical protein